MFPLRGSLRERNGHLEHYVKIVELKDVAVTNCRVAYSQPAGPQHRHIALSRPRNYTLNVPRMEPVWHVLG
jgi:hypothetical protein